MRPRVYSNGAQKRREIKEKKLLSKLPKLISYLIKSKLMIDDEKLIGNDVIGKESTESTPDNINVPDASNSVPPKTQM